MSRRHQYCADVGCCRGAVPAGQPGRRRVWRAVRVGAFVVVVVTGLLSIMLATVRATVLDRGFYTTAFDEARAFNRLYDEVLPDPQASAVARDLTARLP